MKIRHFIGFAICTLLILLISMPDVWAQCAICTKVSADQSEGVAKSFNAGILYLAAIPFTVVGIVGYRWYKSNLPEEEDEQLTE